MASSRLNGTITLVLATAGAPPIDSFTPRCAVQGCYRLPVAQLDLTLRRQFATKTTPPFRGGQTKIGLCVDHTNAILPNAIKGFS